MLNNPVMIHHPHRPHLLALMLTDGVIRNVTEIATQATQVARTSVKNFMHGPIVDGKRDRSKAHRSNKAQLGTDRTGQTIKVGSRAIATHRPTQVIGLANFRLATIMEEVGQCESSAQLEAVRAKHYPDLGLELTNRFGFVNLLSRGQRVRFDAVAANYPNR